MNNFKFIAAIILLGFSSAVCSADPVDLSGSLLTGDGLEAGGSWDGDTGVFAIEWTISLIDHSYWHYEYRLSANSSPGLSHFILQVSNNFTENDFWNLSSGINAYLNTYDGQDPSNPGMPDSIYGLKFEDLKIVAAAGILGDAEEWQWTCSFDSLREPMWGNFYAKGGTDSFAYNTGLNDGIDFIAVPDTVAVPVPAAVLLGMLGMLIAGIKLRKYT
ncbi:MAG: hypothetical protein JW787_03330 [Sedimentisphaerales bacterium]|nr:hypothetical protein [Sedimentisphaerales bacterium]